MSATTCTHHTDSERIACPVCLVTSLRAERDHWQEIAKTSTAEREHNANAAAEITVHRDQLRAELAVAQNWVQHHSKHAEDLIDENVELRAELHQLRSDCDNETKWAAHYLAQSIVDEARADKAEAALAAAKERLRSEAMDDYALIKDLQRELSAERARLAHVLKSDWPFRNRDEIDKDIKEAAK